MLEPQHRTKVLDLKDKLDTLYALEVVDTMREPLIQVSRIITEIFSNCNTEIVNRGNFYKVHINKTLKNNCSADLVQALKTTYLNELRDQCVQFLNFNSEQKIKKPEPISLPENNFWNFDAVRTIDKYEESIISLKNLIQTFYQETDKDNYDNALTHLDSIKDLIRELKVTHKSNHNAFLVDLCKSKANSLDIPKFKKDYLDSLKTLLENSENSDSEDDSSTSKGYHSFDSKESTNDNTIVSVNNNVSTGKDNENNNQNCFETERITEKSCSNDQNNLNSPNNNSTQFFKPNTEKASVLELQSSIQKIRNDHLTNLNTYFNQKDSINIKLFLVCISLALQVITQIIQSICIVNKATENRLSQINTVIQNIENMQTLSPDNQVLSTLKILQETCLSQLQEECQTFIDNVNNDKIGPVASNPPIVNSVFFQSKEPDKTTTSLTIEDNNPKTSNNKQTPSISSKVEPQSPRSSSHKIMPKTKSTTQLSNPKFEPKDRWFRSSWIILGVAILSLTTYLFLKNYYFAKNPA